MTAHPTSWGYISLEDDSASDLLKAREASETAMLRCHYGRRRTQAPASLAGYAPATGNVIFNPGTLQDLADIFDTDIERAFS